MYTNDPSKTYDYGSHARRFRDNGDVIDPNIANDNVLSATVAISDQLTPRTIIALGGMVLMLSTLGFYHWKPEIVMEKNDDQLDEKVSMSLSLMGGVAVSSISIGVMLAIRYLFDQQS